MMVLLLLLLLPGASQSLAQEEAPLVAVYAVRGETAHLPCDLTTEPEDPVILVLWYKNGTKTPVFSMDSRGDQAEDLKGSTRAADAFKGRASLQKRRWNWTLLVREVDASDQGEYRCRLDFQASPTHNARVLLHVVDLPGQLQIYSAGGVAVGDVAVVQVGYPLTLACRATGGDPLPNVTWWSGSHLLDSEAEDLSLRDAAAASLNTPAVTPVASSVTNTLRLAAVTRELLLRNLTCSAANTPVLQPLRASVRLKQTDSLLKVQLSAPTGELSGGRVYEVRCQATGVRPPPVITWWLRGQRLTQDIRVEHEDVDSTLSLLQLLASPADDEALLQCRATAPTLPHLSESASLRLTVHYVPEVSLTLAGVGVGVEEEDGLQAGDSVTMICTAHANPPAYNVSFMFNGRPLNRAGAVQSEWNLTLLSLGYRDGGLYTCLASNLEGDGHSNALPLRLHYPPVCEWEGVQEVLVVEGDVLEMECHVRASPAQVSYTWHRVESASSMDQVRFPLRHKDAGLRSIGWMEIDNSSSSSGGPKRVECHASNSMGEADQPCVFDILVVEPPSPLIGCYYHDVTTDSAVVTCSSGPRSSGHLPETYHVEVREGTVLVASHNSSEPRFNITSLAPGREYVLAVYARHARGRTESSSLLLRTHTPKAEQVAPEGAPVNLKTQGSGPLPPSGSPRGRGGAPVSMVVAGVLVGVVVGVALVVAGVVSRRHAHSPGKGGRHAHRGGGGAPSSQDSLLNPPPGALYQSCVSSPSCAELLTTFSPGPVVVTQVTSRGSSGRTSIRSVPAGTSPRGVHPALRGGPVHVVEVEVDDVIIPRVEVYSPSRLSKLNLGCNDSTPSRLSQLSPGCDDSTPSRLSQLSPGCDDSTPSSLSQLSPGCDNSTLTNSPSASPRCEPMQQTTTGSQTSGSQMELEVGSLLDPQSTPNTQLSSQFHSAPPVHPRPQSIPTTQHPPIPPHTENLLDTIPDTPFISQVSGATLCHNGTPHSLATPQTQSATHHHDTTIPHLASQCQNSSLQQDPSDHDPQPQPTSQNHLPLKPTREKPQEDRFPSAHPSTQLQILLDPSFPATPSSTSPDNISIKLFTASRLSGYSFSIITSETGNLIMTELV